MNFKIIQASPPHTGSTLLLNLIHGFLRPDESVNIKVSLIDKYLITKTHNTNYEFYKYMSPIIYTKAKPMMGRLHVGHIKRPKDRPPACGGSKPSNA